MSDLASALVSLGKAATTRRISRKSLKESTAVVADAIVRQLRSGDRITLCRGAVPGALLVMRDPLPADVEIVAYEAAAITWPVSQWASIDNRPAEGFPHPEGDIALVRGAAVLDEVQRANWHDGSNLHYPRGSKLGRKHSDILDNAGWDLHEATSDERLAFAAEAGAVIDGFRALLEAQGRDYGEAAARVSKVVPK